MAKKYINMGHNEIVGKVVFGDGCVLNPTCSIVCERKDENFKIIFGDYNIIEERALIVFKPTSQKENVMVIGNYNIFGIRSQVMNSNIGNNNTIDSRVVISDTKMGNCNLIGTEVKLTKKVVGNNCRVFCPGVMKVVDVFDEAAHQEHIRNIFTLSSPQ